MLDKEKVDTLFAELKMQMTTEVEKSIVDECIKNLENELDSAGEIWCDIEGYEGVYQVSNFGRVRSLKATNTRILKLRLEQDGYLTVGLYKNGVKYPVVHRLVAKAFIPNPENKRTVNHIDGDKTNNRVENLEWATHKENLSHALVTGLRPPIVGTYNHFAKLTEDEVRYIRSHYKKNCKEFGVRALARKFNMSRESIIRIVRRQTYKNVE